MEQSEFTTRTLVEFILPDDLVLEGELRSVSSPRVIERILAKLPIQSRIHLWKKEFYFEIGIRMGLEKPVSSCQAGDIAYWPQGEALCIFLGKTPISRGDEPRAISPVNIVGRVEPEGIPGLLNAARKQNSITIGR